MSSVSPACRKRRLNGTVSRNNRIKRLDTCRCLDGQVKEPYEMSMAFWSPTVGSTSSIRFTSLCRHIRIFLDNHGESFVLPKQARLPESRNDVVLRNRRGSGHTCYFVWTGYVTNKIKENVWTDRILKLSVKGTFIQMIYAIFIGKINRQKI